MHTTLGYEILGHLVPPTDWLSLELVQLSGPKGVQSRAGKQHAAGAMNLVTTSQTIRRQCKQWKRMITIAKVRFSKKNHRASFLRPELIAALIQLLCV